MSADDRPALTKIENAFLAEYAKVDASGLVQVVGGGLTQIETGVLPLPLTLFAVLQVRKPRGVRIDDSFSLQVRRPSGDLAVNLGGELQLDSTGDNANLPFVLNLMVDSPGHWTVRIEFRRSGLERAMTFLVEVPDHPDGAQSGV